MTTTPNLALPLIAAAQAQKHVTHNEALAILDGLVQLSVLDRDLASPPGSPGEGDAYIVAAGATGAWAGWDLSVALRTDGAWLRLPPRNGWRAWVEDEGLLLVYDGSGWVGTTPMTLQNMALLGVGTAADASNPFSAKLNAALWTAKTVAEGGTGDLFYTMNKEAAGDDLGLTLQTGFSTRALVGLFGSDRFRLAVSADGSTFFDGLSVDNANGIVDQPRLPRFKAYTNYDNYVGVGTWTKIGLNNTDYNDQSAFDAANNHFVAPVDGTYLFGATLLYKINASATARMRGRLVLNGTTEIRGSLGEISATHVSLATAIWRARADWRAHDYQARVGHRPAARNLAPGTSGAAPAAKPTLALPDAQTVTEVEHYTDRLFRFRCTRPASLRFRSGEFVMIGLMGDPDPETGKQKPLLRAYSIASPSWDDELEFYSIKVPDGALTSRLQHIQPGDQIILRPKPVGTLVHDALLPGKRIWFFATGTGIAPFASLLRDPQTYTDYDEVIVTHTCREVGELTYGARLIESIRQDELLEELIGEGFADKLRYYPTTTREESPKMGRITDLMRSGDVFADLGVAPLCPQNDRAMVCGNLAFNLEIKDMLEGYGLREGANSQPAEFVVEKAFLD